MGGDSSSSSNTTNTSGSVGVQGDNAGTIISGVSGSTINTTVTDHGAVSGAFDAINNAIESMTSNNENAFDFAGDSLDKIIESNNNTIDKTMGVVESTNNNMKDLAMQSAANAKETMNFASSMTDSVLDKMESALTGGQSSQTNALVKVMVVLCVVGGVVFTMKAYKGK